MGRNHYALIGDPLGHSMSAVIHERLFLRKGVDADYVLHPVTSAALPAKMPFLRELSGFNVTIPHKHAVIGHLDAVSEKAALYGAVNTVICRDGVLTGHNTDCDGFLRALAGAGIALQGDVLVCGAGGVARMIAFESALHGCRVTLATRESSVPAAQNIVRELKQKVPGSTVGACLLSQVDGTFDLLVNGTPVGMYPKCSDMVVPHEVLKGCKAVFDTIYNPLETRLLASARALGLVAESGLSMLVWQAAAAQELWLPVAFTQEDVREVLDYTKRQLSAQFGG